MKPRKFELANDLSVSIEIGVIDNLIVQVPWMQLHTGLINALVENVHIVMQLNTTSHKNGNCANNHSSTESRNLAQEIKLNLLSKEEINQLDESEETDKSWLNRYMRSIAIGFLSKLGG